jgi:hypothetical protein
MGVWSDIFVGELGLLYCLPRSLRRPQEYRALALSEGFDRDLDGRRGLLFCLIINSSLHRFIITSFHHYIVSSFHHFPHHSNRIIQNITQSNNQ